jgi:hypothetical protein
MLTNSSEIYTVAAALAAIIDEHAGDYPLVSLHREAPGPDTTWLYATLVVEVFIDKDKPVSIGSRELGGVSVYVSSPQQGMALLRQTEAIRQQRDWPYIRLS